MNQKGTILPFLLIGAVLIIAGITFVSLNNGRTKSDVSNTTQSTQSPSATPGESNQPNAIKNPNATPAPTANKSTCNTTKDVCFDKTEPNINIQEGYLEDANYWISNELMLTGKGSGGYEISISGFPKEFSVRVPDQNFADGGKEKIYLRAQKNVAAKGTHKGTISVRSYSTNVTHTANLTINYIDWNTSAIHTDPTSILLDCTVKYNVNGTLQRELVCDKNYDTRFLKFYYYKNNKTIEVRTNVENSASRSLKLTTEFTKSNTLKDADVYTLHYDPDGVFYDDLNQESDGVYRGYFSFLDQSNQKEVLHIPYTFTIHSYKP